MSNTPRGLPLTGSRVEQIFPKLTQAQVRRIAVHGHMRVMQRGEVLVEQGDSAIPFFVLRRVELVAAGVGDVVLIGSTHSGVTLRIKEFLMRNGYSYSYINLQRDPDVQTLLDSFHILVSEIPVVVCRGQVVLRNPSNQQIADCLGINFAIDQTHVRDLVIIGAGPSGLGALPLRFAGFAKSIGKIIAIGPVFV